MYPCVHSVALSPCCVPSTGHGEDVASAPTELDFMGEVMPKSHPFVMRVLREVYIFFLFPFLDRSTSG